MNKKPLIIGCSIAAAIALLVVGFIVIQAGKKVANAVQEQTAKYEKRSRWRAPEPGSMGTALFPATVDTYALNGKIEPVSHILDFEIPLDGEKANYGDIDVLAWETDEPEPIFDQVLAAIDSASYSRKSNMRIPGTLKFSISPPRTSGRFYANKGWLFLFTSNIADGDQLAEFEELFIDEIDK